MLEIKVNYKKLDDDIKHKYRIPKKEICLRLEISYTGLNKKIKKCNFNVAEMTILLDLFDISFETFTSLYIDDYDYEKHYCSTCKNKNQCDQCNNCYIWDYDVGPIYRNYKQKNLLED